MPSVIREQSFEPMNDHALSISETSRLFRKPLELAICNTPNLPIPLTPSLSLNQVFTERGSAELHLLWSFSRWEHQAPGFESPPGTVALWTVPLAGPDAPISLTSRCQLLPQSTGSRTFVLDLSANQLGPGWRRNATG